jgi:hypothetical protein
MRPLDWMISTFDAGVLRAFGKEELQKRDKEFRAETLLYSNAQNRSVNEAYDSIDTKATAVLQHVSIMIAVSGVLYSQAVSSVFGVIFVGEMLLYIILALLCLRLLMAQHFSGKFSDTQNVVAKEALFDLTAKLTYLISIVLILTVAVEVLVK